MPPGCSSSGSGLVPTGGAHRDLGEHGYAGSECKWENDDPPKVLHLRPAVPPFRPNVFLPRPFRRGHAPRRGPRTNTSSTRRRTTTRSSSTSSSPDGEPPQPARAGVLPHSLLAPARGWFA